MDTNVLAYVAGIIDGEGAICIAKRRPNRKSGEINFSYWNCVRVGNTDRRLIEWLRETFCIGSVQVEKPRKNNKAFYTWHVASKEAADLLVSVYDYLVIKKEQAEVVFRFRKSFGGVVPKLGVAPAVLAEREACFRLLQEVHHLRP
jgi:hypothetical protein